MEDLFPALMVLIAIIGSIASTAKKNKESKKAEQRGFAAAASAPRTVPQHTPAPSRTVRTAPPMSFSDIPGQVITPTVHVHLKPDCAIHDKPGSLGVASMEGKDPCHEEDLVYDRIDRQPHQQEGGLTFDWTGDTMVKAVVMQEVLTRPANRFAARRSAG